MINDFKYLLFQKPRLWKYEILSDIREIRGRANLQQPVLFTGKGTIIIGKNVVIGVRQSPFYFSGYAYIEARQEGSVVEIGDRVWANNNLVVISNGSRIVIGHDTLIGTNVEILDSDFHGISPSSRRRGGSPSVPVLIESNVWIGSNVKILKGVSIGRNSIIANGSVVTKSIPENVIAGGIPAEIKKHEIDKYFSKNTF
jgi:acetyltransferase-like isoleucine patch superfamily enzyme